MTQEVENSNDWRNSDIVANMEPFLLSTCLTYIISLFSVISIYKGVN